MPIRLLSITTTDGELVPAWYSDRDRPWLRKLLSELEACEGRPLSELMRRWQLRTVDPRVGERVAAARHLVLNGLRRGRRHADLAALRRELFVAVARGMPRADALSSVAARHGVSPAELDDGLFADLSHAAPIAWPWALFDPTRLILALNLAIAQGMLRTAEVAELRLLGASRAVLRTAWLHGAWFHVAGTAADDLVLRWQRTRTGVAGVRGLLAVLPTLPWADRFQLRARCDVRGERGNFALTTHDPILPGPEPCAFDSALEQRFARDVLASGHEWDLLREPAPIVVNGQLGFPDFLLQHRPTAAAWLVEIAGLRDRTALPGKLAMLDAVPRLILLLPRALVPVDHRAHPRVLPFGRTVDAAAVLRRLRELETGCSGMSS